VNDQDTPGPIDRGSAQYPSDQVAAIIRGRIASGHYPPGARLPSNVAFAEELGTAPRTVRKAIATLAAEGLVEVKPGWGTFTAAKPVKRRRR
jgi:DNA-binding GntR family transcriptional regulator